MDVKDKTEVDYSKLTLEVMPNNQELAPLKHTQEEIEADMKAVEIRIAELIELIKTTSISDNLEVVKKWNEELMSLKKLKDEYDKTVEKVSPNEVTVLNIQTPGEEILALFRNSKFVKLAISVAAAAVMFSSLVGYAIISKSNHKAPVQTTTVFQSLDELEAEIDTLPENLREDAKEQLAQLKGEKSQTTTVFQSLSELEAEIDTLPENLREDAKEQLAQLEGVKSQAPVKPMSVQNAYNVYKNTPEGKVYVSTDYFSHTPENTEYFTYERVGVTPENVENARYNVFKKTENGEEFVGQFVYNKVPTDSESYRYEFVGRELNHLSSENSSVVSDPVSPDVTESTLSSTESPFTENVR